MDLKTLLMGAMLLFAATTAYSAELTGTCGTASIQCDLTVKNMQVCNDSPTIEDFSARFSGDVGSWFNVIPDRFTLAPGECTQLRIYTVASCYANPGTYSAMLIVQGKEAVTTTCTFDLSQGHFLDVEVEPQTHNATQCEEKNYSIHITNNTIVENQNTERADITVIGMPQEWYELEARSILIPKGETETVNLRVTAPCDADFGAYPFTVRAATPNPAFYGEDTAEYVISQGQGVQILPSAGFTGTTAQACLEESTEAKVKIVNNGRLADTLRLTLTGPQFVGLGTQTLSLAPGEEKEVAIRMAQTGSAAEGSHEMTLGLQSMIYDYSTSKTFAVELGDCYNVQVAKTAGDEIVCAEDTPLYSFELTNDKSRQIEFTLGISGIATDLQRREFTLEPGESMDVDALLQVGSLADEGEAQTQEISVELLIDTSGSMAELAGGKTKIDAAKTAAINLVNGINQIDLGLRVFGQGELCEDSELLRPITRLDIPAITGKVSALEPKGKTPLVQALIAGAGDFGSGKKKVMIVVSDGKETCEGNITAAANELATRGITAYTIGFAIDAEGEKELREIAAKTGGAYYEASNADELGSVLKRISQELRITKGTAASRTFTLTLDSERFSYEKDYTISVSDCHNAQLLVPELSVCGGAVKQDYFTIANLGSQAQEFAIKYSPEWVSGPSSVTVPAGESVKTLFSAMPPRGAESTRFSIEAFSASGNVLLRQEKAVNSLPNASCYGIDMIMHATELDAATCEGQKQTIIIENRGAVEQQVEITADKPYVEVVDGRITVGQGERKEIYYFVSPPFDLPSTTYITFTAVTNNGFETQSVVRLTVRGNEESYGTGEVDIRLVDLNITIPQDGNYDAEARFGIYNDSNRTLRVFNIRILDYNGIVQAEEQSIAPGKTMTARLLVNLPEGTDAEMATVPVSIQTDEGTYTRNVVFTLRGGEEPADAEDVSIGTGLFTLANLPTAILGALILMVIALIAYSSYRAVKEEPKQEIPDSAEAAPGKPEAAAGDAQEEKPARKSGKKRGRPRKKK